MKITQIWKIRIVTWILKHKYKVNQIREGFGFGINLKVREEKIQKPRSYKNECTTLYKVEFGCRCCGRFANNTKF
jgi:hypothetical protein